MPRVLHANRSAFCEWDRTPPNTPATEQAGSDVRTCLLERLRNLTIVCQVVMRIRNVTVLPHIHPFQGRWVLRHSVGVWSVTFLKRVLNVDFALNPTVSLIASTVSSVWISNAHASRIRHWLT
jgi:kynureninase